jgi:tetratricopeptide (TPR) repeat protein
MIFFGGSMRSKLIAALIVAAISCAAHAQSNPVGVCKDPRGCTASGGGKSSDSYPTFLGTRPLYEDLQDLFGGQEKQEDAHPSAQGQARQQRREEALAANNRGAAFHQNGEWAKAVAAYQEAVNKDPSDPVMRDNLARAQAGLANLQGLEAYNRNDFAAALALFQEAASKDPKTEIFRKNLAETQTALKRAVAEQNRRDRELADTETAARMRKRIEAFTASLDTAAPTVGLVIEKAGATGDLMGTHKANPPPFAFGSPDDLEAASEQARQGFDNSRPLAGSRPVARAGDDPASRDPQVIAADAELAKLKADRLGLDAEIDKLRKARLAAADTAQTQTITLELNRKVEAKATKLVEIYKQEEKSQKLRRSINTRVAGEGQK